MRSATRLSSVTVLALVLTGAAPPGAAAQATTPEWPRWRGSTFTSTARSGRDLFSRPFELKVRWKRTLGAGYSGIVVAGGRAVTMFSDGTTDVLIALDAATGAERWRVPVAPTFPGRDGSTGGPVSTPAIDGETVFALGPRGDLVAVRLADGRAVWKRHLVRDLEAVEPHWGFTTSPLVTGGLVIVLTGGTAGALTAFDTRTGATVWRAGSDEVSYQSPILATIGGQPRVIAGGDRFLYAIDPKDGREIWRYEHQGAGFYGRILNPVPVDGDRLLLTYKPDQSVLLQMRGDGPPVPAWTTRELKLSYVTPVVHGGVIFGYSGAFLSAVEAATGALAWRSRPPGDGFPILFDDHLVILTKQGGLTVAEPGRGGFAQKAAIEVFSHLVWTPPSVADGRIFARDSYADIAAIDVLERARLTEAGEPASTLGKAPASPFARWVEETERAGDRAERVKRFVDANRAFPLIEDDRFAHVLFVGDGRGLVLRSDAFETGRDVPFHRVADTDLYYVSLELPRDARISYQIVRELGETLVDPANRTQATSQNFAGPVSLLMMPGADRDLPAPAGALRGRIVDLTFDGPTARAEHLTWGGKRQVRVYLPPGYDADPGRRYPAVYVLYGNEMLEDGNLAAAVDRATGTALRPALLVFVQNISGYEYARSFRDVHARMLAERLVPWIDGQFRTAATPRDRILLGADEGGFAAVEVTLRYPEVFGNAVAQSLFPLSAGDAELLALIDRSGPAGPDAPRFHVDWGTFDPRRRADRLDVPGFSARVRERLRARGFAVTGREWNDGSTLPYWSARAVVALRQLLGTRE